MRLLGLPVLFASLLLAVPAAAQESGTQGEQAVLTPGDSVRIVVWRKPEFSGDFVVAPNGTITHPLFRSVQVAGMPYAQAERNLRTFLARFEENPEFVMEPLIRVFVSGQAVRPGTYAHRPETTISEAVARAGGANQTGDPNHVQLRRLQPDGRQQEIAINLGDFTSGAGALPVRSGDQIIVLRKKNFVRDVLLPTFGIIGSIASIGLLIDRISRNN